jgi:DNA recombination protein RmuC
LDIEIGSNTLFESDPNTGEIEMESSINIFSVLLSCGITTLVLLLFFVHRFKNLQGKLAASDVQASQVPGLIQQVQVLSQEKGLLEKTLDVERAKFHEKLATLQEAEQRITTQFKSLSADALALNNKSFLQLAQSTFEKLQQGAQNDLTTKEKAISNLIDPVQKALTGVEGKLQELEKARLSAYEVLKQQVTDLTHSQKELRNETANLAKALRAPSVRGRWGEMQLKRVVEVTGMSSHCDFIEQSHFKNDHGQTKRPDMIVKLPGNKHIIIDAKAPISAYLEALEATDDATRIAKLREHARQVRSHINILSSKNYWSSLPGETTPDFVVMFLPGETFFTAALEQDHDLIELGVEKKVILTTPATLIALLHAVAYGWRQESLAENAKEISRMGQELYKRLSDMGKHFNKMGRDLKTAVHSYNNTLGSLERRVIPSARRFQELQIGASKEGIELIPQLEENPRDIQSEELLKTSL